LPIELDLPEQLALFGIEVRVPWAKPMLCQRGFRRLVGALFDEEIDVVVGPQPFVRIACLREGLALQKNEWDVTSLEQSRQLL
jgi:hypothetical protein